MAQSVTAANKQIQRLKAKLQAMKDAAMAAKKPKAPKPTLATMKRRKAVQARIDAAQAVIADLTKKVDKFKAGESDYKASTIVKMEKRIEKLEAMIASLQKSAKRLTVYNVRLMLNETQVGEFGPYATIRAASADAKNILRMHLGPDNKIEEIGVDEPLMRSDGKILAYFHPSIYTGQQSGGGILTAQVVETGGASERTATFVSSVKKPKKKKTTSAQTSLLPNRRRTRSNPRGYVCVNDRYCPQPDTFTSLAEFQAMCKAAFGERAHLTRRGSDYVDERGQVVLRSLTRR